ncbi:MAG: 50S ribosomal protein L11 methyltransferase [Steroidobacteraceae bacterium]
MAWLTLQIGLEGLDPDAAEVACLDAGAVSVTLTDAADDAILEPAPGELRLWPHTTLQALFSADAASPALLAQLAATLGIDVTRIRTHALEDRPWEREWLKDYHAMQFGPRLWVAPGHEVAAVAQAHPAAVVLELDPGLAFGTGTHPTTALCLQWLEQHLAPGSTLIDYGCGSGILAIAALKLGAGAAACFDIDPQALIATRDNAATNDCTDRLRLIEEDAGLPPGVDLVLANIISGTLCDLAPRFAQLVRPGGDLVMAGLLCEQAPLVTAACSAWFDTLPFGTRGEWTALVAKRRA